MSKKILLPWKQMSLIRLWHITPDGAFIVQKNNISVVASLCDY